MLTTDQIEITDLHLRAIIGIKPDERQNHQDILINITLDIDTRPAALSDDIADAVNYRTITKSVINLVENSRFFLVEKLATAVAQVCLEEQRVQKVRVSVEKPSALRFAASVGVTIERSQNEL
ncbi:MAG: dihydroneopterin aldolase [Anaerolineales bacterium]|nr:dihydroneopterin aldolase [Anaerolineales bacterium]